jgi:phospho-N-acetylmuramoyl-pentapeptide-transferase
MGRSDGWQSKLTNTSEESGFKVLYHLLYPLHVSISAFNVFRYITFRAIYASLTAFLICFVLGPWFIRKLRAMQVGQYIRDDGPQAHLKKAGTPTMGGTLIIFAVVVSTLLWANLTNFYIWILLGVTTSYAAIGFVDDYLMQVKKRSKGLSARGKLALQALFAILAGVLVCSRPDFNTQVTVPFFKNITPELGWAYVVFAAFVIVGTSNAVNLTDGLDGLAIGPVVIASVTYMIFAYVAGHVKIADYLQINYVAGSGEVTVFCSALAGAGIGFLWFNAYPAQMFMGDVGSLPLGGALGAIAVITKQEILLVIVGGLFVMEALSVIFQVGFFKVTKGRRIFRMAPLHHHFELKGWAEPKVIVRFWIIAIALALVAMSTLKLR